MSDAFKTRLISIGNTYGSVFLLAICTSIVQLGHVEWNVSFWIAIVVAAARFAFAEFIKSFVPVHLGGRRK